MATSLNAEEENALRYVSRYVALKLMRKYQKEDSEKAIQFVECLSNMAVVGDESSFNITIQRSGLVWLIVVDSSMLVFFLFFFPLSKFHVDICTAIQVGTPNSKEC